MPIDPDRLLALDIPKVRQAYDWRDCIVYALGLGFGQNPTDPNELAYVYEDGLRAFPTMANVLGYPGFWMRDLDTGIDWRRVVHGEQAMRLHRPLPPSATVVGKSRVVHIADKGPGKGALLYVERVITDADSREPVATLLQTAFCRGDGGFGGDPAPLRQPHPVHERAPDRLVEVPTSPQMALVYRLSGDLNPLHADPEAARRAGFDRPILHGLATFGLAGRALVAEVCEHDETRLTAMEARFSAPVFPRETVTVDVWHETEGVAAFRARVAAREAVVLANGHAEYTS